MFRLLYLACREQTGIWYQIDYSLKPSTVWDHRGAGHSHTRLHQRAYFPLGCPPGRNKVLKGRSRIDLESRRWPELWLHMLCTAPRGPQSGLSSLLITVALLSHVSETSRGPESWILRFMIDIYRFDREMVKDTHLIFLVLVPFSEH